MSRPMFRSCSNSGRLATAWARRCRKAPLAVPSAFCRPGSARARAAFSLKAGEVMATTGGLLSAHRCSASAAGGQGAAAGTGAAGRSGRPEQEFHMDRVIGEEDAPVLLPLQEAGLQQGMHVAL